MAKKTNKKKNVSRKSTRVRAKSILMEINDSPLNDTVASQINWLDASALTPATIKLDGFTEGYHPTVLANVIAFFQIRSGGAKITIDSNARRSRSDQQWDTLLQIFNSQMKVLIELNDWGVMTSCRQIAIHTSYLLRLNKQI